MAKEYDDEMADEAAKWTVNQLSRPRGHDKTPCNLTLNRENVKYLRDKFGERKLSPLVDIVLKHVVTQLKQRDGD